MLNKISNSSYSVLLEGVNKHIAIDNMSKTVIKDNSTNSETNVDDSVSTSEVDSVNSDNESTISDFSDVEDLIGLQQHTGTQPVIPVMAGRAGRPRGVVHPPHLSKKTRSGKMYKIQ